MPRKRTYDEVLAEEDPAPQQRDETLHKIRNMWEFAALYEFINLFGRAVKIQPVDIEDLEAECAKSGPSDLLEEIGFQLLKFVSSRRDITLDNWDKTVRTQYEYKMPTKPHPYGADEEPNKFRDFHVYTKLRVLYRLCQWTLWNPDNVRKYFPDMKETDQFFDWQAHPCGWDRHDRTYYKLSGNRLYRRTDPPIPPEPTEKKTPKKGKASSRKSQKQRQQARRSSKRRKVGESEDGDGDTEMNDVEDETVNETTQLDDGNAEAVEQNIADTDPEQLKTYGEYKWECVAVTLDEYNAMIATIAKSKDANEKNLKAAIEEDMIPELVRQEERRQRKLEEKLRHEQLEAKMAGAKRSGRLAAKQDREKQEAEAAEAERHRATLLAEARRQEDEQHQAENDRRSRMQTREQRIKEREYKRVLLEEQLARDSEEEKKIGEGGRGSRHLKERIEKRRKELEEFEEEDWTFDCSGCGRHGKNWDDGEHSIACERCNVWQHSKCLGFTKAAAESDDFHFICRDCKRKEEDANRPKISLKFKNPQSSSPPQPQHTSADVVGAKQEQTQDSPVKQKLVSVNVPPASRPANGGYVLDGQFFPAPDPLRPAQQSAPLPPAVAQPSMPGYAVKGFRQLPYMNGGQQQQCNGYPAQERLPGNGHAQNLYNQIAHPQQQYHLPQPPHQTYSQAPFRPSSSHSRSQTPRPPSSHSQANGQSSPIRQRIPSPIINRPTMSPTQGNPDVGPIAGVPGSSPTQQPATLATPYTNGRHSNGTSMPPQSTPSQPSSSQTPSFSASQEQSHGQAQSTTQPISGLSPTKQRQHQRISTSPLPQPTLVPQKNPAYTTPSSSFNARHGTASASRTVSGTPIFPPAENLAPSPQQLNREPVPTPRKHESPFPVGANGSDQPSQSQSQSQEAGREMEVERARQVEEGTVPGVETGTTAPQ